jgi:hypothetical protein
MAEHLVNLDVRTREQWRQWLAKHHASSPGIWLARCRRPCCGYQIFTRTSSARYMGSPGFTP